MWHESRRQEKLVKGMIINYQKRAERRKDHYEKMKSDPLQLLRITGTSRKLYLNPSISNNEYSVLVPWQGDRDIMISRFDVRAHLDYIADQPPSRDRPQDTELESHCQYERYRQIIYNKYKGISQDKALAEISIEEMYPVTKPIHSEKKSSNKTAIGYHYDTATPQYATKPPEGTHNQETADSSADEILSEIGNELDFNELDKKQFDTLDEIAIQFGLQAKDFSHYHQNDLAEHKQLKEELFLEKQKSITKSKGSTRKERRALKLELKSKQPDVPFRSNSPLSYACRQSPTYHSRDKSDSSSYEEPGKIEYITEFGSLPRGDLKQKKRPKRGHMFHSSLRHRRSRSRERHREKLHRQRRHSSSRSPSRSRSRERHNKHSKYTRERSRSSSSASEEERPIVKRDTIATPITKKKDDQPKVTHFEKMQQRMQTKISKQLLCLVKQDQRVEQAKFRAKVAVQEDRESDIRGQMKRWRDKERERLGEEENLNYY